ncbi:MAG: hypothetical protein AB7C97_01740 [Oscillospiraceae bacterium]
MKKYKYIARMFILAALLPVITITAYADSSWHWISDTRPYDILPFVVIGTLLIETIAVNYIPKIHKLFKVFCIVTLGNILSYLAPYIIQRSSTYLYGTYYDFVEHYPLYNVGLFYLILTVAVELPFCYFLLKRDTANRKILLVTIFVANVVTTALVAIVERFICVGRW